MTSRERFLTAIAGGVPDRVPATPDMSNYIPVERTGLPFWEVYFNGAMPMWRAYLDAAKYYGIDAWVASSSGVPIILEDSPVEFAVKDTFDRDRDAVIRTTTIWTPDGPLTSAATCFRGDPPSPHEKPIKNFNEDWKRYKWLLRRNPKEIDAKAFAAMRTACESAGAAFGVCVGYPGFQGWEGQAGRA